MIVKNIPDFFSEVKANYKYVVIDKSPDDSSIKNFIRNNFEEKKIHRTNDANIIYFKNVRQFFRHISEGNDLNENIVFGDNYQLYKLF